MNFLMVYFTHLLDYVLTLILSTRDGYQTAGLLRPEKDKRTEQFSKSYLTFKK